MSQAAPKNQIHIGRKGHRDNLRDAESIQAVWQAANGRIGIKAYFADCNELVSLCLSYSIVMKN